jgi:hypothetical protein
MLVTLAGYDIMRGRALLMPTDVSDFAHLILACLFHDIGYVRGIVKGDGPDGYVADGKGGKTKLPRGASDAALMPYHVDRSKLFVMDRRVCRERPSSDSLRQLRLLPHAAGFELREEEAKKGRAARGRPGPAWTGYQPCPTGRQSHSRNVVERGGRSKAVGAAARAGACSSIRTIRTSPSPRQKACRGPPIPSGYLCPSAVPVVTVAFAPPVRHPEHREPAFRIIF